MRPGQRDIPVKIYLLPLFDEHTVLVGGAEIDVDPADFVTREGKEFGVAEALATSRHAFVSHKSLIALDEDFFELMALDPVAVLPTALKIGRLVDLVVIRAREGEIVR